MRKISLLPNSQKPREKILKYGSAVLTLEELLAVILVTGTKLNPVSKISGKIYKLLQKSAHLNKESLTALKLGSSKTAQILAILELAKRLNKNEIVNVISADQVFALSL